MPCRITIPGGRGGPKKSSTKFAGHSTLAWRVPGKRAVSWLDGDPEVEAEREKYRASAANANGQNNSPKQFQFTSFRDINLSTAPPYTVKGLIPRLGIVIIWGPPKCGKTFWTFDLEMHIALGWPYRDRRVEHGEVLHIACEGIAGLGARKEAWRQHHAAHRDDLDSALFHLCKETTLDLIADANAVVGAIVEQFSGRSIRIITIDTLNRSLKGSESKDQDMAAYIRAAVLLAEKFQCAVLIIHHCGYDQSHPRGHTGLVGAGDADIKVNKTDDGAITSEVKNMRDGADGEKTYSRLKIMEVGHDDDGEPITSCVIIPTEATQSEKNRTKTAKPPSPAAMKFYEAFCNVAADFSELRPESGNRPSITEGQWKAELFRRNLLDPIPPASDKDTQRKLENRNSSRLSKYRLELVAAGWITCNNKLLWSTRELKP
jgi:AAA domain